MSALWTDLVFVALGILIGMAVAAPVEQPHDDVDDLIRKRRGL